MPEPTRAALRAHFPALDSETVFLDNAGGAQLPRSVIEGITRYLVESYVQVGGDYAASRRATANVAAARALLETLVHAGGVGHVALGPSTSQLCANLAAAYADAPADGRDEVVVHELGHESNIGPWARLARRSWTVRTWEVDPATRRCDLERLRALVGERTRVVALCHASNLLGCEEDVAAATRIAHAVGARVVVDGVAYAPHRAVDVQRLGCDWYVWSTYKVFGPHMAALYGRREAFLELEGPNHFFVPREDVPYKFELGGALHEGCAGIRGLAPYLAALAGAREDAVVDRALVERAFARVEALERPLTARLLGWLRTKPAVDVVGPAEAGPGRFPTVAFRHARRSSRELALHANERGLGLRWGHFYAHRLCTALGIDPADGVVRASLVHYNTEAEVERLIEVLDPLLG